MDDGLEETPELYYPGTETDPDSWTDMADVFFTRTYHTNALLLPDATVLVLGGWDGSDTNKSREIFEPPYLFTTGGGLATRPCVTSVKTGTADNTLICGQTATVLLSTTLPTDPPKITVSLIRLGSFTHQFDMDQRFMELAFTRDTEFQLSVTPPDMLTKAPPGYYMLFVVVNGVPSESTLAQIVQMTGPCPLVYTPGAEAQLCPDAGVCENTASCVNERCTCPADDTKCLDDSVCMGGFCYVPKNRFISPAGGKPGAQTAIRVTLTNCPLFPDAVGWSWWLGAP